MYNGLVEDGNKIKGKLYIIDIFPILPSIRMRLFNILNMLDVMVNIESITENIIRSYLCYIGMIISPISNFIYTLNELNFFEKMFIDSDLSRSLSIHSNEINSIGKDIGTYIYENILKDNVLNDNRYFIFKDVKSNGSLFFYIPDTGELYD